MPLCTVNKWGCGTTTEKVPDTEATKAMKEKLAATLAERARQDALWQPPLPVSVRFKNTVVDGK